MGVSVSVWKREKSIEFSLFGNGYTVVVNRCKMEVFFFSLYLFLRLSRNRDFFTSYRALVNRIASIDLCCAWDELLAFQHWQGEGFVFSVSCFSCNLKFRKGKIDFIYRETAQR